MQHGGMAEWTKAAVLKTVVAKATVGSNPTPTATLWRGAGVVELDCLLSSYGESHRGFESHPLRSHCHPLSVFSNAFWLLHFAFMPQPLLTDNW